MNSLPEIIREAQKDLYCPTCGRSFNLNEIHIRSLIDHTVLLQTLCANGHVPVIMIFIASVNSKPSIAAINNNDVIKAHAALKEFDGNFVSLWKKTR